MDGYDKGRFIQMKHAGVAYQHTKAVKRRKFHLKKFTKQIEAGLQYLR